MHYREIKSMNLVKPLILIIFSYLHLNVNAQENTVGVLSITEEALKGYTFFSPFSSTNAYMVDHCGRLVNQWSRGTRPGLSAYFLENGLMLRSYKVDPVGPFTSASNAGGVELVDWDNNTVWHYEFNTEISLSHHDVKYMPNGNILVLIWDLVFRDEIVELGRDPDEIAPENFTWSERIIEIEPIGDNEINIVWEWRIKEHYIQDFDETKLNFGVVSEHPELFDINLPDINSNNSNASRDWNHFNAIDYNEELDQILISTRNSDEIWIIDHSTTTEEAATHTGGNSGKGGDLIYRWGNPSSYQRATIDDQKLFGQHGINWIQEGLVDAGKILIFNNGNGRPGSDISTVEIINPPTDYDGLYVTPETESFGPLVSDWTYGLQGFEREYSPFLSNAQRLSNGNTLINYGSLGYIREITPSGDICWEYEIPLNGNSPANQGNNVNQNASFRVYKFAPEYPGFDNIDVIPMNTIESNSNITDCLLTSVESEIGSTIEFKYDQLENQLQIVNPAQEMLKVSLINSLGQIELLMLQSDQQISLNFQNKDAAIYWIFAQKPNGENKIFKFIKAF